MKLRRVMTRITVGCLSLMLPFVLMAPAVGFAQSTAGGVDQVRSEMQLPGHDNGVGNNFQNNGDNGNHGLGNNGKGVGGDSGGGGSIVTSDSTPAGESAPEIDPASLNAALALLVGGAMWLRHRKPREE